LDADLRRIVHERAGIAVFGQPQHRRTPVVVLSSSDDERDVSRAYELGASTYLVKPGEMAELVKALETYWQRHAEGAQGRELDTARVG
jgi:DNA-binding response OmpR family regulator